MGNSNFQSPFGNAQSNIQSPSEPSAPAAAPFNPMGASGSPVPDLPFGNPDDDTFSFDLSNVDPLQGRLPVGSYVFRLADVTDETAASSGNRMFVFHLAVVCNADGTPSAHTGKVVKKNCALTEKALGILAQTVAAFDLGQAGKPLNFSKKDAVNRLCFGEMVKGTYNGQDTTNVGNLTVFTEPGKKWNPTSAI